MLPDQRPASHPFALPAEPHGIAYGLDPWRSRDAGLLPGLGCAAAVGAIDSAGLHGEPLAPGSACSGNATVDPITGHPSEREAGGVRRVGEGPAVHPFRHSSAASRQAAQTEDLITAAGAEGPSKQALLRTNQSGNQNDERSLRMTFGERGPVDGRPSLPLRAGAGNAAKPAVSDPWPRALADG